MTERIYEMGGLHFTRDVRRKLSPNVYTMQLPDVLRSYDNSDIMTSPSRKVGLADLLHQ
jgi:hypothetical protein